MMKYITQHTWKSEEIAEVTIEAGESVSEEGKLFVSIIRGNKTTHPSMVHITSTTTELESIASQLLQLAKSAREKGLK